ncbi:putative rhamnosyl transferase [Tropicibacter sp. Alg240-R139]|uniref:putative rhamnosyl transferase n=1 Tax=Tropicibacter sp. Alg240-R139 TaxID=2305991 RepID=UPI0013DEE6B0|nr:putative rhamnosyl transferase [Tropicibacter sp. Alg240-R139]
MQVIGLCRFSYPALGGFQIEHESLEARRRFLYDPARLEERFALFETISLPCFREQTDDDFTLLVVTGTCLPRESRDRLQDVTANMKQIQIVEREPDRHRPVMKQVINSARKNKNQPCLQFRHDDDDAVSVDFVERLRAAPTDAKGLMADNATVAIDFNNGFLARLDRTGIKSCSVYQSLLGVGLGMYVEGGCNQTIMNFMHHRMGRFMPVISYPDAPMWVRSFGEFNDSNDGRRSKAKLEPLNADQSAEFQARFAIDEDLVRQAHAAF